MLTEDGKHLYVSYDEYHNLIERLAIKVHQSGWRFDTILCLARGGMRPGDVLSRIFNVPLAIWILEGFISSIPKEMDDIARVDGYGFPAYFVRILLPQIAPGVAVAGFFCFMFSWIEYLLSNALTVIDVKPIGAIMSRAGGVMTGDVALLATAGVLGMIPGVILILFMKKHLARGFSMGRVV